MSVTVFPAPSAGGAAQTLKTININSTQSWTAPTGVTNIEVLLVGGGGGGGGASGTSHHGGGGGGGGVISQNLTVTPGTSYTVTIGAGGAVGANSSNPGSHGSNSSFGTLALSYGGSGGYGSATGSFPAAGLVASGGGQGNNGTSAAAAGGSGGGCFPNMVFTDTAGNGAAFSQGINGIAVKQGTVGYVSGNGRYPGNAGINGYGAGGGGAVTQTGYTIGGGLNAGDGATGVAASTLATANFGGGGGGANATFAGSAGGSGVCIIKYWS